MFNIEKTLLLARAAFMHGYIIEAKLSHWGLGVLKRCEAKQRWQEATFGESSVIKHKKIQNEGAKKTLKTSLQKPVLASEREARSSLRNVGTR